MKSDLDRLMAERGFDALLVTGSGIDNPAMYYLTNGAKVGEGTVLVKKRGESPTLVVSSFEIDEAAKSGLPVIDYNKYEWMKILNEEHGNWLKTEVRLYEAIFADLGVRGTAAMYGRVDQGRALALAQEFNARQNGVQLVGEFEQTVFDQAWTTKDAEEVGRIRAVGDKTVTVVGNTAEFLQSHRAANGALVKSDGSPLTIGDVKREIRRWLLGQNLEDPEGVIFAIGRDGGVPHSVGEDRDQIALGRTIVFDLFPREAGGGYYFDFTRTWCVGYAPPQVEKAYRDVLDIFNTVVAEIKMDDPCRIHQLRTCQFLEERGHPTRCSHPRTTTGYFSALGHGIGLSVHESPRFGEYEGNADTLAPGCVVTIEPGVYYPDEGFGIRIEDCFWMNPKMGRLETLAEYSKELVLPVKG